MLKAMLANDINVSRSRVLVLGVTFKEDCPDIRNTKVVDLIRELQDYGVRVDVHDPCAPPASVKQEHDISLVESLPDAAYDGVVIAVAHRDYRIWDPAQFRKLLRPNGLLFDLKHVLAPEDADLRL
jgi:UDP-N-acetyl-D-galactosamine dehydrogenase